MFAEDAVVLHAFDPGGAGAGYSFLVDDVILKPQIRYAEPDHVVHNGRDVFGCAKDINEVDGGAGLLADGRLSRVQIWIALQPQHLFQRRIDRNYAIAILGEIAPDVMAGAYGGTFGDAATQRINYVLSQARVGIQAQLGTGGPSPSLSQSGVGYL